jgi:hypothetical protein
MAAGKRKSTAKNPVPSNTATLARAMDIEQGHPGIGASLVALSAPMLEPHQDRDTQAPGKLLYFSNTGKRAGARREPAGLPDQAA